MSNQAKKYLRTSEKFFSYFFNIYLIYWRRSRRSKLITVLVIFLALILLSVWGIGRLYISGQRQIPLTYGVSYIPDYAQSLGLDPKQTYQALLGIGVRQFRLTSYWSDVEPAANTYDFSMLDYEFSQAQADHAKIILTVGLRQPRWPECHPPNWIDTSRPENYWQPALLSYMSTVINRYKDNPALEAWQLENEYFLTGFGFCNNFSRERLVTEDNLLKTLDPRHPIIIGRSNNAMGFPIGQPTPDVYGISVYKRVWDANVTRRYLEYPYPSWFYSFLAGVQQTYLSKNMIIDELQAEAWPPNSQSIEQTSLIEQNKSLDANRLMGRFSYGQQTGMKDILMWGAEYWYYRMEILHDPSLWQVATEEFKANNYHSGQYFFAHLK